MTLKPWLIATLAILLVAVGFYLGDSYQRPPPKLQVEFDENSCAIRCPADSAFPSSQGSVTCTTGSAPLCQCIDPPQPMARCVPVN
jgi:hypothetical protein